jgi:hypothetical protein
LFKKTNTVRVLRLINNIKTTNSTSSLCIKGKLVTQSKNLHHIKTVAEFEAGYWYASELKQFVKEIGVPGSSRLRKDQLEGIIKSYIEGGTLFKKRESKGLKYQKADSLALDQKIENYVSNKKTKSFIMTEAQNICPNLPKKSGVWYWTNRWREEQFEKNKKITYLQLIQYFVKLSTQEGRLPQIPSARFNNFITDFLAASEGNREEAKIAWEKLKSLDIPKTYTTWKSNNV